MKINTKLVVPVVLLVVLISALAVTQVYGQVQGGSASCYSFDQKFVAPESIAAQTTEEPPSYASASIKTGNNADIVIMFTSEAVMFTDTKIVSKGKDTTVSDTDQVTLKVWANVTNGDADGNEIMAEPGVITFAERIQTLSGKLNMLYDPDIDGLGNGGWTTDGQEIELMLQTTNANGFNFIAAGLPEGEHTVTIYAEISSYQESSPDDGTQGSEKAPWGAFGKRTLILDQVRMVNQNQGSS